LKCGITVIQAINSHKLGGKMDVAALIEALKFYAKDENYRRKTAPSFSETWCIGLNVSKVEADGGGKAIKALKQWEEI
jgi:hypothetical protein